MTANELIRRNVRAAATGVWTAVIIAAVWLTFAWIVWLLLLYSKPGWVLALWGGGELTWKHVQLICLAFMGLAKLGLFAMVLVGIALTVWQRILKRTE